MRVTRQREELLKLHPDVKKVKSMKSCEWKRLKTQDVNVQDFLKNFQVDEMCRKMCIRQTFRGGLVSKIYNNLKVKR